ncbi:hypothetical protein CR64_03840 [Pseudomonas aeruginosa]|nr:hypothetical protein CR64_03840 [Pseudomonas aeruginosa]
MTILQMQPDQPGDIVLSYVEVGDEGVPTGKRLTFSGVEFRPLGYSDLSGMRPGQNVIIPLNWQNAKVIESTVEGIAIDSIASANATLQSPFSSKTIGLVKGGWLPSGLALQANMIVLPDRCTISEMSRRFRNGAKTRRKIGTSWTYLLTGASALIHCSLLWKEISGQRHLQRSLSSSLKKPMKRSGKRYHMPSLNLKERQACQESSG